MSIRLVTSTVLASLCALAGVLAFAQAPAQAALLHKYEAQITEVPSGRLGSVGPMTTDSGDLYLSGGGGIYKFDVSTGAFLSRLSLPGFGAPPAGIAFGRHTGETELYGGYGGFSASNVVAVFGAGACGTLECPVLQHEWTGADTPNESFVSEKGEGFGALGGVAVDESPSDKDWAKGDVFVATHTGYNGLYPNLDVVDVFTPEAGGKEKYVGQLTGTAPGEPFESPQHVAVSGFNGDVVVVDYRPNSGGGMRVDLFEPTGLGEYAFVRQLALPTEPFENVPSVAVNAASGEIYVAGQVGQNAESVNLKEPVVYEFSANGELLNANHGGETPAGSFKTLTSVAVDPVSGKVFAGVVQEASLPEEPSTEALDIFGPEVVVPDVTTAAANSVKARSATLNGTVNPDEAGAASCELEWGTSRSLGQTVDCSETISAAEGIGDSPLERRAELTGLQPDTTYYYRMQATNAHGTNRGEASQDQELTTAGPGLHGESASSVTSASATLNATIDPNNASTTYYFQYGTSASYGESVPLPPGVAVGSGKGDLNVGVHLQGLAADTTYHYRVVAVGEPGGEVVTVEGSDATFTTQAAGTELTLPDGRAWELVTPPDKRGAGIYALGWEQGDDIQAAQAGNGITYGMTAPFVTNPAGSRSPEVTQAISLRSAPGVWSTQDIATAHNEGATFIAIGHSAEYKLFSSDLSLGLVEPDGDTPLPPLPAGSEKTVYLREAGGGYEALVSSANVPAGCKFGGNGEGAGAVGFAGGTPDMSHIVLGAPACLSPGHEGSLYEWSEGHMQLIDVLPNGEVVGGGLAGIRRAISNDGARVVWTSEGTLYLRDMVRGETVPVAEGGAAFQIGDGDGSRVFFTTNDGSLNVFEVTSASGEPLAGEARKLTEEGVVDGVIGASEDGSSVYFVDSGVLGDGAERGAKRGGANLYVESYDEATKAWRPPSFIALLSAEDAPTWGGGHGEADLDLMTARVSPNGRYLAFMSERSLTGYENRDANSGVPDEEVFLYDASTGRLVCASCNPTGARPVGILKGEVFGERLVDYTRGLWDDRWLAANIPGWTTTDLSTALYQSRYLSDSGRLFFNSSDALVPADVNGKEDVYEYEPPGVGSCQPPGYGQSASDVFVERIDGCVGLISAGTSSEESVFMDASEGGGDVFFLTLSKLSPRDFDTSLDIYDAHECTAASPCASGAAIVPPPCTTGDSCKPAPSAPPAIFGAPSSETFAGAGNVVPSASAAVLTARSVTRAQKLAKALKACGRSPKRKRAACRRQARKKYGARSSRVEKSLSTRTERRASGGER